MLFPCKRVVAKYKTLIAKMSKDHIENEVARSNLQKLLDLELILGLHYILPLLELVQGKMYTFVILLNQSRCVELNYMSFKLILNVSSRMKLLIHSIAFWLESMMGCLCFLLNRPPLIMINVLQNSMVTLCSFTLGTVKLGLFYL